MQRTKTYSLLLLGLLVVPTGCELEDSCDPDQELHEDFRLCVDVEEASGGAGGAPDCPDPVELVADHERRTLVTHATIYARSATATQGPSASAGRCAAGHAFRNAWLFVDREIRSKTVAPMVWNVMISAKLSFVCELMA